MSETPPKKRTIRLQVINESGDMTTISATRSASVDEVIELLTLGAQDILPNAPSAAISIFLKKNGTWEEEVKRGTNLSDYKQLKKKTARIKVILDPEVMKKIHDEISHKENEKLEEEEKVKLKAAEQGQLNWNTLGYAKLLEAREKDLDLIKTFKEKLDIYKTKETKETKEETDGKEEKVEDTEVTEVTEITEITENTENTEGKNNSISSDTKIAKKQRKRYKQLRKQGLSTTDAMKISAQEMNMEYAKARNEEVQTPMGKGILLDTRSDGVNVVELDWTLANNGKAIIYTNTTTPMQPQINVDTFMGKGKLLKRREDGINVVELDWTMANNGKAMMYASIIKLTKEEEMKNKRNALLKKQEEQKELEIKCLKLLKLVPTTQIPFKEYDRDLDPPRVHMSDFNVDRKKRKVISLTIRGQNFTETKDIELHEDSLLLHLYLAVEEHFNIPMIHMNERDGMRVASPGILLRRSWAQFTAGIGDNPLEKHGGILKLDMVGCPSKEWKEEEKLGSLVHPNKWFEKLMNLGVVDESRSGLIIVDDLRPPDQRKAYDMVLSQHGKKGMGFIQKK